MDMIKKIIASLVIVLITYTVYSYNSQILEITSILTDFGCEREKLNERIYYYFIHYDGGYSPDVISCGDNNLDVMNMIEYSPFGNKIINIM